MTGATGKEYGLRPGAEEFPLMVVIAVIYPCNFGCPMCPYTDGNSEIRQFISCKLCRQRIVGHDACTTP